MSLNGLRLLRACGLAAALSLCASVAVADDGADGRSEQAQPAPTPPAPPAALPTPPEVLGAIGRFLDQSINNVGAGVKGAGDALGGASDAATDIAKGVGDAAGTVARLPLSNIVSGRAVCVAEPNRSPDCAAASVALCKSKGFATGASMDITTSRKCPARVWLEKREPVEGECVDEAFVSKAICQ